MSLQQDNKSECEEIIPKQNYKCFDIDKLDKRKNYYLLRAANTKNEAKVFRNGVFSINTLLREPEKYAEAAGLSLNLLGGNFTKTHLKYIQKGIAASYWVEGKIVTIEELSDYIELDDGRIHIYFPIWKIHNLSIPFEKNIESKLLKILPQGLAIETKEKGVYQVEATLNVKHAPTNANFWHVEFQIVDKTKNSEKKIVKMSDIKSYKAEKELKNQHATTKLVHSLLNRIKFMAKKEIEANLSDIPTPVYMKNPTG